MRQLITQKLGGWQTLAYHHWKEHCPTMFKQLLKAGKLPKALEDAADQTALEMDQMMEAGFNYLDAWEAVRQTYLLLPEEPDLEEPEEETDLDRAHKLMGELIKMHQEAEELRYRDY